MKQTIDDLYGTLSVGDRFLAYDDELLIITRLESARGFLIHGRAFSTNAYQRIFAFILTEFYQNITGLTEFAGNGIFLRRLIVHPVGYHGFIASVIKDGTDIVRHAAINRYVAPDSGYVLDYTRLIQRHPCPPHD